MNSELASFYKAYMAYIAQQDQAVITLTIFTLGLFSAWLMVGYLANHETGLFQKGFRFFYDIVLPIAALAVFFQICYWLWVGQ